MSGEEAIIRDIEERFRRSEKVLFKKIENIRGTLYGNGELGLMTEIALIKKDLELIIINEKSRATKEWAVILGVLVLIIDKVVTKVF